MFTTINNKIKILSSIPGLIFLLYTMNAKAQEPCLSLATYLAEVRTNNLGHDASSLIAKGASLRSGEGKLLTQPTFFAEGQYLKDNYDPDWSPIAGNSRNLQSYKLGISENTPFGLQGRLYYNYQHQTINGIAPNLGQATYTASSPVAELNLPLSRNWAGRETRATAHLINAQAKLTQHTEQYRNQMLMARAESAYWRLAISRSIVCKQQESFDRALKIYQWVNKRTKLRLAESSDLLQAQAAVDVKRLDIQSAVNDERLAEQDFNTLRGYNQGWVPEKLTSFCDSITDTIILPAQVGTREDVWIEEQEQKVKIATAELGIEKNKPDVDLYASYAFNGNNPSTNQAIAESFTTNYPSTAIGLRLSIPLDFGRLAKDRRGYRNEIKGAKCQFQQKVYDNLRLWQSLMVKIENAKKRLDVATELEAIQGRKLTNERERLSYGRTTTFQVLTFEQDYASAQIARLVIQDEILELMAQLKTFGV